MVKSIETYLPDVDRASLVVSATLKESRAWSTNGISVQEKLDHAFQLNERFGLILLAQITFGLRMKEALCLRPWKADNGSGLTVYPGDGPKGGRPRFIPYLIPEQAVIIGLIKDRVKKIHWLGWEKTRRGAQATLESNTKEYFQRMKEIGITRNASGVVGHGLRAEFAVNMARVKGFDPATEEYTGENPPWDELQVRIRQVSELMGHSRSQIMASYFGAFRRGTNGGDVDYVGVDRTTTHRKEADDNYASASARTIDEPGAAASIAGRSERTCEDRVVEPAGSGRRKDGYLAGDYRVMTSLIKRFSAPEYRGRGCMTPARDQGEQARSGHADGDIATRSPDQRQLELPFQESLM